MVSLSSLDDLISSRSLLRHPFYQKWSAGELTMEDMRAYAKEYFHLVSRIPGIVARVRDRARTEDMRERIGGNMLEEMEHAELWKRFAASVGVSKAELEAYLPSEKARDAVRSLEALAEGSFEDGVVSMYALELELPKIAQSKKDGLAAFYGLTSEDAHAYFDEHLLEEKHLRVWRSFMVDGPKAAATAESSVAAQHLVLDAVCDVRGIACAMA